MPPSVRSNYSGLPRLASKQSAPSSSAGSFLDPRHEFVPVVITTKDLQASLTAFETLLSSAKAYRNAMLAVANATSTFAAALEECARQKGAMTQNTMEPNIPEEDEDNEATAKGNVMSPPIGIETSPAEKLMAAAGLHHLLGNHNQILSDSFYRHFEVPLMEEFDNHRRVVAERQAAYEKATQEKARVIRETESRNIKMGRKKLRDLASFRQALTELQAHVNDLDNLKIEHYSEVYEGEQDMWETIAGKTSIVVRREVEMYDRIVSKGSADPILEAMGQQHPDPFNSYAQKEDAAQLFSILPPLSMLTPSQAIARTSIVSSQTTPTSSAPATPPMVQETERETPSKSDLAADFIESPLTPKHARPLSMVQEVRAGGSFDSGADAMAGLQNNLHSRGNSTAMNAEVSPDDDLNHTPKEILEATNGDVNKGKDENRRSRTSSLAEDHV